jgi:hypothetical protein
MFFKRDYTPPENLKYEWIGTIEHNDQIYRVNRALTRMNFGWRKKDIQTIVFKLVTMDGGEKTEGFVLIPGGRLKKIYNICGCLYDRLFSEFLTKEERSEYYPDDHF